MAARAVTLPFPFPADQYRYGTNVEAAPRFVPTEAGGWGSRIIDIDGDYQQEIAERGRILQHDPSRCQTLPHMRPAVWDTITMLLPILAAEYPDVMAYTREGSHCTWSNDLLGLQLEFTVGDDSTLGVDPLEFISGQIQDDIALLDEREGALWLDAGVVTFAADWCLGFDVGMRFAEIHGPVPRVSAERIVSRAEQFLMHLQPGEKYRRTNWSMTVDRRLDTSTDVYPEWGRDRRLVEDDPNFAERMHLRVEVQHLIRLPTSGAILFLVRTYLISLAEIATVPAWRERVGRVLEELPEDMADYKGLTRFRHQAAAWLLAP
ncbi:DUF3445 domain-containing protein [Cryobacterium melibiosiphilum]|uniref:DUF3445 domain-containing protein n=1 Tax=Cryobacterium melibiosiphilum TaxID=995039 RepID=A0A3A5MGZ5_9MICO|nr:DUF3445 domain-containing protein [Cryobacterium melibiosiphilum]